MDKKITITFPEIKINMNWDNLSFDTLEEAIFNTSVELSRAVFAESLESIDKTIKETRPKKEFENKGKEQKHFMTRFGNTWYKRTRYRQRSNGNFRYLLEEKLGLRTNQRISSKLSQIETLLASSFSYRDAKDALELITSSSRSHEATRQTVLKEGGRIEEYEKGCLKKIESFKDHPKEKSPDVVYHEVDSAYIKKQASRKRKQDSKRPKSKNNKRNNHSIEIKLGIGYTGKEKRYPSGTRLAQKLANKFTFCDISTSGAFMKSLSFLSDKRFNLTNVKQTIIGGDGASWIRKGCDINFINALYVLCKFHLQRAIKRALPKRKDSQKIIKRYLDKNKIKDALSHLKAIFKESSDAKEKDNIKKLYIYIRQNQSGINSLIKIKDPHLKEIISNTGAIESNVDKFIAHRFKKRGMSWSKKGALALLKIKQLQANDEWNDWWKEKRDNPIKVDLEQVQKVSMKELNKPKGVKDPLPRAGISAFRGPRQNRHWVELLRRLQSQQNPSEWRVAF